jgi:hypothetical protein
MYEWTAVNESNIGHVYLNKRAKTGSLKARINGECRLICETLLQTGEILGFHGDERPMNTQHTWR